VPSRLKRQNPGTLPWGLVALLAACGHSRAASPPDPVPRGDVPARAASSEVRPRNSDSGAEGSEASRGAKGTSDAARVSLERPEALRSFFEALARLEEGGANEDVTVLQFGASHTAADVQTGVVRRMLQERFGDGGRGFVSLGRPWAKKNPEASVYLQEGVRGGMMRPWAGERGSFAHGRFVGDGLYGLLGFAIQVPAKSRARAFSEISATTSSFELHYLEQPHGGTFDVLVDGVAVGRVKTAAKTKSSGARTFEVEDGRPHTIEVRPRGDGTVRIFGLRLDREESGVVLDALGINGARATVLLQWDEAHFAEQLARRAPGLVVLAYGVNESNDETPMPRYEEQLRRVLSRIAGAAPQSACLLLGPPDRAVDTPEGWVTSERLVEIIEAQRRVAAERSCAFYSQFDAMGGRGTIAAWVAEEKPRARGDYVHYTRDGYLQLGRAFGAELLRAYDAFRAENVGEGQAAPAVATSAGR
jgi:hypothetical protein